MQTFSFSNGKMNSLYIYFFSHCEICVAIVFEYLRRQKALLWRGWNDLYYGKGYEHYYRISNLPHSHDTTITTLQQSPLLLKGKIATTLNEN